MPTHFTECLKLSEAGGLKVDRALGLIRSVKVLGWKSANNREYLRSSVTPSLYEGRRVCVGHQPGERSPLDTYGILEGVTVTDAGVYADRLRLLNPDGEFEKRLLAAAESAPHLFGLSHTAQGREKAGSNGRVIEAVEYVESVDLVSNPATVAGFYESRKQAVKKTIKQLIESLKPRRPGYSRALKEMAEAGIMGPDASMDAPAEEPAESEGGDHKQALKDACKAVLDDDSLSSEEMVKKIKDILKMIDGGKEPPAETETETETETAEESRKKKGSAANLREEMQRLKARDLVRTAADEAGIRVPAAILEAVRPSITESQVKALVAELKGQSGGGQRPRSAGPVQTTNGRTTPVSESTEPPTDAKAYAAWLQGK